MRKRSTYLLSIFLLLLSAVVQAQTSDEDTASIITDTVAIAEDYEQPPLVVEATDTEVFHFDLVSTTDKMQIQPRHVDDSAINKLRKDEDFWYVNEAPVKKEPKAQGKSFIDKLGEKEWFRNLLWVLVVGGFIAVLIWFIVSSDIQLFKGKASAIVKTQEDELSNQSIYDINYDMEIQKAIATDNLRLAVRLLYLQTLKNLSEANIINYKQEHTNSDYLVQLYGTTYYDDFFRLTRHFEYVWYGQFPINQINFEVVKNDFFTFKNRFFA